MTYHELFGKMIDAVKPDWGQPTTARVVSICAKIAHELFGDKDLSRIREFGNYLGAMDDRRAVKPMRAFSARKTPEGGGSKAKDPIESAYMGEHPNIQPDEQPAPKKALCASEQRFYDYVKNHPGASKPAIQNALGISQANYYWLKKQCIKKGWLSDNGAIVNIKIGNSDDE